MTEIILQYFGSDYNSKKDKDELITCKFKIRYSPEDNELKEAVKECMQWMGTIGSPSFIMNSIETEFELKITGRGKDFRCGNCRSFRTRLRNILSEKGIKLKQNKCCRFDKGEYGVPLTEQLRQRINLYELGLSKESEEDIEMARKALGDMEG